jgi:hypothetical protein
MAVTAVVYNAAKKKLAEGTFALTTDTIKVALLTSSYTPNIDTHDFFDDVSANEISATGTYAAGGGTLANRSITVDTTNDRAYFDADDLQFTGTTIADYRYLVIYKSTGTAGTSPLLAYVDLGSVRTTSGDTAYIQWSSDGIFRIA